jgi:hypothetical protein
VLDVRKPFVVFISQRSEELRLYNLAGLEFDNFKPGPAQEQYLQMSQEFELFEPIGHIASYTSYHSNTFFFLIYVFAC